MKKAMVIIILFVVILFCGCDMECEAEFIDESIEA